MSIPAVERKIRRMLPVIRFVTTYIPVSFAQWMLARIDPRPKLSEGLRYEPVEASGVPCAWLIPENSPPTKALLYIHGGGFLYGLTSVHLEMAACLARKMGVRVLMIDYRLAPKHPFPAALDDCVGVYQWLLAQGIAAENIAIAGDSAGGNLTLTTLLKLRDRAMPLPAAAVCLSPVVDLSNREKRFSENFDALLHPRAVNMMLRSYIGQGDARNPLISPIFGDLQGLPPLLIHAGEEEVLRDDAVRLTERAREAGVAVRLEIYPRMWHVWQINLELPQAEQSLEDIAQFLQCRI